MNRPYLWTEKMMKGNRDMKTMKTKANSQSGFLHPRTLVSLVLFGAASSILAGTLLAFLRPDVPGKISNRTLTSADRVAYQHAIEEVYWHHRIWPTEFQSDQPDQLVCADHTQTVLCF